MYGTFGQIIRDDYDGDISGLVRDLNELSIAANEELYRLGDVIPNSMIADLLRWYPSVVNAMAGLSSRSANFEKTVGHIRSDTFTALRDCHNLLHIHRPEPHISGEVLDELKSLVNELLNVLSGDTDLDAKLRDLLLAQARKMDRAIRTAQTRGTAELRETLAETLGSLYLNAEIITPRNSNSATWQKVTAILGAIAAALSLSTAAIQALEGRRPTPAIKNVVIVKSPAADHVDPTLPPHDDNPGEVPGTVEP
jgi:hypothetical protein